MFIIYCSVNLRIPMAQSLKDKRNILKSLLSKCKNKFNIAVAEIDKNESWKNAVIGIVAISNEKDHLDRTMNQVIAFIEDFNGVILGKYSTEYI